MPVPEFTSLIKEDNIARMRGATGVVISTTTRDSYDGGAYDRSYGRHWGYVPISNESIFTHFYNKINGESEDMVTYRDHTNRYEFYTAMTFLPLNTFHGVQPWMESFSATDRITAEMSAWAGGDTGHSDAHIVVIIGTSYGIPTMTMGTGDASWREGEETSAGDSDWANFNARIQLAGSFLDAESNFAHSYRLSRQWYNMHAETGESYFAQWDPDSGEHPPGDEFGFFSDNVGLTPAGLAIGDDVQSFLGDIMTEYYNLEGGIGWEPFKTYSTLHGTYVYTVSSEGEFRVPAKPYTFMGSWEAPPPDIDCEFWGSDIGPISFDMGGTKNPQNLCPAGYSDALGRRSALHDSDGEPLSEYDRYTDTGAPRDLYNDVPTMTQGGADAASTVHEDNTLYLTEALYGDSIEASTRSDRFALVEEYYNSLINFYKVGTFSSFSAYSAAASFDYAATAASAASAGTVATAAVAGQYWVMDILGRGSARYYEDVYVRAYDWVSMQMETALVGVTDPAIPRDMKAKMQKTKPIRASDLSAFETEMVVAAGTTTTPMEDY